MIRFEMTIDPEASNILYIKENKDMKGKALLSLRPNLEAIPALA